MNPGGGSLERATDFDAGLSDSASATQRRSKLAFSPLASATDAIEIPGRRHAATTEALNVALWRRRRLIDGSTISEAFTCPPKLRGHEAPMPYRRIQDEFAGRILCLDEDQDWPASTSGAISALERSRPRPATQQSCS